MRLQGRACGQKQPFEEEKKWKFWGKYKKNQLHFKCENKDSGQEWRQSPQQAALAHGHQLGPETPQTPAQIRAEAERHACPNRPAPTMLMNEIRVGLISYFDRSFPVNISERKEILKPAAGAGFRGGIAGISCLDSRRGTGGGSFGFGGSYAVHPDVRLAGSPSGTSL